MWNAGEACPHGVGVSASASHARPLVSERDPLDLYVGSPQRRDGEVSSQRLGAGPDEGADRVHDAFRGTDR